MKRATLLSILATWAVLFCFTGLAPAAAGIKVAVLPVSVQSGQNLGFLGLGVREMLASRFSAVNGVTVLDRSLVDRNLPAPGKSPEALGLPEMLELGRQLAADHLVATNILSLGGGMSIDVRVYSIAGEQASSEGFYKTVASEAEVIAAIDQLALRVARKKFGLPPGAAKSEILPGHGLARAPEPGLPTAHPDRAFVVPVEPGTGVPPLPAPSAVAPLPAPVVGGQPEVATLAAVTPFGKSQNLGYELQAMDVGDIDGDGQDELVVALKTEIVVYRREENRLTETARQTVNTRYRIHGVFIADLDHDNHNEVYISAADHQGPNSLGLAWQDGKFRVVFQDAPWYIKPVRSAGRETILAGQRGGFKAVMEPGIYRLRRQGDKLVEGEPLADLPRDLNVFNFAYADIDGDGRPEVVGLDSSDRLRIHDLDGPALWTSSEYYGGVTRYIGGSGDYETVAGTDRNIPDMIYVPARLVVTDLNNDGRDDVVVKKDLSDSSRLLRRSRKFPSGVIEGLAWNGLAMTPIWSSARIEGSIADSQLRPVAPSPANPQRKGLLYLGLVLSEKGLLSSAASTVLFYPVPFDGR